MWTGGLLKGGTSTNRAPWSYRPVGSRSTASGMGASAVAGVSRRRGEGERRRVRMGVGVLAHCWVLGQQDRPFPASGGVIRAGWGWLFRVGSLLGAPESWFRPRRGASRGGGVVGVVRVVVWELHSGREHLIFIAAMITPPGVVWWRRECSHL